MSTFITANELYQRQTTLLGKEVQDLFRRAKILVIGVGGLGCPAIQYLASAGIGELGIVDFDRVSASNLQRQILFTSSDIGRFKTEVARERLEALSPFCKVRQFQIMLNEQNARELVSQFDIILDCTDNFHSKFIVHDAVFLEKKVLVQAAVYQFEGQLQVFDFRNQTGPCWRCLWPEPPLDGCTGTCAEVGVLGPLLGVVGSMQAAEALKFLANKPYLKNGSTLFIDLLDHSFETRRFKEDASCICCGQKKLKIEVPMQIPLPQNIEDFIILDVRSNQEFENCSVIHRLADKQKVINLPLERVNEFIPEPSEKYLTICAKGIRSLNACKQIRKIHAEVYSLTGGISGENYER